MPARQSKRLAVLKRRQEVAELYLRGWTQTAIAEHMELTQPTISQDLSCIRALWRESSIRDFDAARDQELRKLDLLEREAWAAWKRSQEPAESTKVVQDASGKRAQKTVEHPVGDPRYLEQVQKCIAARRAILGLDAPTRIAPTSPDGADAYHTHVMLELMRIAEEAKNGPLVIDAQYVEQQVQAALAGPGPEPPNQPKAATDDGREA